MSSPLIPKDNCLYNSRKYWDKRYESIGQKCETLGESPSYDWLVSYEDVKPIINKCVPKSSSILMLGCGNSLLSEQMFIDGYHRIHNIDYSSPVIEQMAKHCPNCSQMEWSVMDCSDLRFDDQSFDTVLEKATIDALLTKERDPWNISIEGRQQMSSVMKEVYRVLKSEGQFISISFSGPHLRYPLLKSCIEWQTMLTMKAIHELETHFHYYCYEFVKTFDNKTIEFEPNVYESPKMTLNISDTNETMSGTGVQDNDNDIFDIDV